MDQSARLRGAVFCLILAAIGIGVRSSIYDLDELNLAERIWTGIPIYTLVYTALHFIALYLIHARRQREWSGRVEMQRAKAYYAMMYPERVFKDGEYTTFFDLETEEILASNDPMVHDANTEFFDEHPERRIKYPLTAEDI